MHTYAENHDAAITTTNHDDDQDQFTSCGSM